MGTTQYELLGPLTVRRFGAAVPLGSPELQRLLAALLLESNDGVSPDRLIAAVWGTTPPPDAAAQLAAHVEQLRQLVNLPGQPELLIQLSSGGYVLCVEPGDTDLGRYLAEVQQATDLRQAGHPTDAASRLRSALSLWKGEPLAGLQGFDETRADLLRARTIVQQQLMDLDREIAYRQPVQQPYQPAPHQPHRRPTWQTVLMKLLGAIVPFATLGFGSCILIGTLAIRRRSIALGVSAGVYLILLVLFYWLYPSDEEATGGQVFMGFLFLLTMPVAAIQAAVVIGGKNSVGGARQTS